MKFGLGEVSSGWVPGGVILPAWSIQNLSNIQVSNNAKTMDYKQIAGKILDSIKDLTD